eukprot:TRINITY_DN1979_c0_g1_i3.p1 TRINITY_DN1979_c0_g1~~TRINITY_DN1979_c0_g1_i3.p1  ORF type:complete len:502 (+),score=148.37 TRINITY_DN1979_c0_g1_i3:55-1560(+)
MGDFETIFNYTRNTGEPMAGCIGPTPKHRPEVVRQCENAQKGSFSLKLPCRDARAVGVDKFKLEAHGFQLVGGCARKQSKAFYYDNQLNLHKMEAHNKECEAAIAKAMGGNCEVKVFHNLVRSSDAGNAKSGGAPAGAVHCDYSVSSSLKLFDGMAKAPHRTGRFAIVNAWRNIADTPIERQYLAMCSGLSVVAPDDFVSVDVYNVAVKGPDCKADQSYRMDPSRSKNHEWWYFPAMKPDEMLLFMQYDSHASTPSRYCFHSAVADPREAYKNKPTRESCETRCVVFFPGFVPNSIPVYHSRGEEKVENAAQQILIALQHPDAWPAHARKWMAGLVWNHGPEKALNDWAAGMPQRQEFGMDRMSPAERAATVKSLLKDGSFEAAAKKNFPRPAADPVKAAPVKAAPAGSKATKCAGHLVTSVSHGAHWDAHGKKWATGLLSLPNRADGIRNLATGLVSNFVHEKKHGVDELTAAEREALVAHLCAPESGFESAARKGFGVA